LIPGAATLEFSTRITETVAEGSPVARKPRVSTRDVSVQQLKQLVRAYRDAAGISTNGVNQMIASEGSNGAGTGLRNEVWGFVEAADPGWLPDTVLKRIFADEIAGYKWVPRPTHGSAAAAAPAITAAPPAPLGWVATFSPIWGWLYRNNTGAALTISPTDAVDVERTQDEGESDATGQGGAGGRMGTQLATSRSRSTEESPAYAPQRRRQRADGPSGAAAASAGQEDSMDTV
jgi:hypothetical protein